MSSGKPLEAHKARAMELANGGIESLASGDYQTAQGAWREALAYAERYLPGDNIIPWIRSGLGDTLLKSGDYPGALEMARSALAYCASVRAPLAALTMAVSLLRIGDAEGAREYVRQACSLQGEEVLRMFSSADREALTIADSRVTSPPA